MKIMTLLVFLLSLVLFSCNKETPKMKDAKSSEKITAEKETKPEMQNNDDKIVTESVAYKHGDVELEGFLAYDSSSDLKRPGIIVVHEWTGLGDYAKSRAKQLAGMGYIAFAIDMYGKGVFAKNHEEAGKLAGAYFKDRTLMRERAKAGLDVLLNNKLTDSSKVAAIGYCFGGASVLELARAGADVKAVVSFHGVLANPNPADSKNIKCKVLVLHGEADAMVNKQVDGFKKEMEDNGVDYKFVSYPDAVHGFTVPDKRHNKDADMKSWEEMKKLFAEVLK